MKFKEGQLAVADMEHDNITWLVRILGVMEALTSNNEVYYNCEIIKLLTGTVEYHDYAGEEYPFREGALRHHIELSGEADKVFGEIIHEI